MEGDGEGDGGRSWPCRRGAGWYPVKRGASSYHLLVLEERGFATSRYEISEQGKTKGKAIRLYTATDKVADVKATLKKGL